MRELDTASLLQTHAEVAMALGGFASVAAALGRPLSTVRRQRFLALLFLALVQVVQCLLPVWLAAFVADPGQLWRTASLMILALTLGVITVTVILPLRRIGPDARKVLNPSVSRIVEVLSVTSVVVLPVNAIGIPWAPSFPLYYLSALLSFGVGFLLFADVVVSDRGGSSSAV